MCVCVCVCACVRVCVRACVCACVALVYGQLANLVSVCTIISESIVTNEYWFILVL